MKRILVTGATGNIGREVIKYLFSLDPQSEIYAAVRNIESAKKTFRDLSGLRFLEFNFEDADLFANAFREKDLLFLLRPPHLSNVEKVFKPLLHAAKKSGIKKIVFLSVQGAEKSKVIPHNKVERLIIELQFDYIFVRPSYFMQNLTTTLLPEILNRRRITLPSGKAKFNWIDVKNIGEATAHLILKFDQYQHQAYDITGAENKSFDEVTGLMSDVLGERISFISVNPIRFYFLNKREGMSSAFALVITILHWLPSVQAAPNISDNYQKLTGKVQGTLQEFIERERLKLTAPSPITN